MRPLLTRFRRWRRMRQFDRDLADEIETHRTLRQGALEASGIPARDAERASRRALGNVTLAREDARAVWVRRWLDDVGRDLRHAARLLRRSPAFTSVAIAGARVRRQHGGLQRDRRDRPRAAAGRGTRSAGRARTGQRTG